MNKRIERKIQMLYNKVFEEVFGKANRNKLLKGKTEEIQQIAIRLGSSYKYTQFAKKFAEELAKEGIKNQKGLWRKYYNAAKKSHYVALPKTYTEFEQNTMKEAIYNNFKMIKSIPEQTLNVLKYKYAQDLIDEVAKGKKPRGYFEKELRKHGNANAKVIARTETAKLNTNIIETRALNLGAIAYIWRSSHDRRTRPSHQHMNNVVVFWQFNKPHLDNMYGHCGEFPNCRCTPLPIVDEADLTQNNYKVYDYRTDNIITLTKNQLLTALNNGHL